MGIQHTRIAVTRQSVYWYVEPARGQDLGIGNERTAYESPAICMVSGSTWEIVFAITKSKDPQEVLLRQSVTNAKSREMTNIPHKQHWNIA
jgi:hypothetical protein